jgi:hypothetical protein
MFQCTACQATEFQLMLQPGHKGTVEVRCNEFNEILVQVNSREFIADLLFMNQFAVCRQCGGIRTWQYHFPTSVPEQRMVI